MLLLASCPRGLERHAYSELRGILKDLGITPIRRKKLDISGLLLIEINVDALDTIRKVRAIALENPWKIRLLLKLKPIQIIVESEIHLIVNATNQLVSTIQAKESFRVTLNRRHTTLDPNTVIEEVAKSVDRKVNLDNPDKIILVEVLGPQTGVSVVTPDDIISFVRIKRG